jgi:DNA-cytosine methyltransferase
MKTLKVLDIFSGIGGFSYALDKIEHNGQKVFETVAFCEIDTDCHRVLKKHWPEVPIFTDVSKVVGWKGGLFQDLTEMNEARGGKSLRINFDEIHVKQEIDVIVGGFPCTDISVAGKQKGLKDEELIEGLNLTGMCSEDAEKEGRTRSGLWTEYKRIIKEVQPRFVIIENVRNLLGNGFTTVLSDLNEIGYDAEWEVISARDVGQCHLRERLWIVAYPNRSTIRNRAERTEIRRHDLQSERETEFGNDGPPRTSSDSDNDRRLQGLPIQTENQRESLQPGRVSEDGSTSTSDSSSERRIQHEGFSEEIQSSGDERFQCEESKQPSLSEFIYGSDFNEYEISDSNNFRFWPSFASEEEKSEWWAEATFELRNWRAAQPELCGVYDGPTTGLHEKFRRARIRQLGNGIVSSIAQIHGQRIAYHEFNAEAAL